MTSQPEDSVSTRVPGPEHGQDTLARDPAGPDQELPGQDLPGQGPSGPDGPGEEVPGQGPLGPDVPGGEVPGQGPLGPDGPGEEVPGQGPLGPDGPGSEVPGQGPLGPDGPGSEVPGQGPAGGPEPGLYAVDRIAPLRQASSTGLADQDAAGQDPAAGAAAEGQAAQPGIPEPGGPAGAAVPGSSGLLEQGAGVPAAALAAQQWPGILALFVDDPRGAVERAAATAREQAAALTAALEREQATLRDSWQADASTEDLRTALQQYRSFCGRLEAWA